MLEKYVLFIRPDKASRGLIDPPREYNKEICEKLDFIRTYYNKPETTYLDKSSPFYIKIDVKSTSDDMRLYLNQDHDGTADVVITGVGLMEDLSFSKALKILLTFDNI